MDIRFVRNAREARAFIRFPFRLYRDSPYWTPPLIKDMQKVMDKTAHPYYQHSEADFLLAQKDGQTSARLAVLNNKKYNQHHGEKTAFFYFFDAKDDAIAVKRLFSEAEAWARQRGLERLVGPVGFLQGDSHGVLVKGFEHPSALGQAYNYEYYDRLLTAAGFDKKGDYFSGYLPGAHQLSSRFYRIAEKVKANRGFWIKSFDNKKELQSWIFRIQELYNQSFVNALGFRPLNEAETRAVADRLLAISDPRLIKLVMKEDSIIGFIFAFVDITQGLRKARGRMWPLGWLHILRSFRNSEWVNINGTGLLPGHRGVGANAVLYTEIANTIKSRHFKHADVVQISEENFKSMRDMQAIGVEWYKTHRVYQKRLV